jgi:hypothetical protein
LLLTLTFDELNRLSPKVAISRLTGPFVEAQHPALTVKVADIQRQIEDLKNQLTKTTS